MPQRWSMMLLLVTACVVSGRAAEPPDPRRPIHEVIDRFVTARLHREGVSPASTVDATVFIRRTSLDLIGRPPTAHESKTFAAVAHPDKRSTLVARLMESPEYARHQANEFDHLLMGGKGSVRGYLLDAFAENRSWDRMFRELILGRPDDGAQKGALQFVKSRVSDLDKLTNDTSVVFFGVNISCAKCHDHPHVSEWTQDHFFGMKSFFNRTFDNGGLLGERSYGLVKFKTTSGAARNAKLMFLNGQVVAEPPHKALSGKEQKAEKKLLEELKKKKQPPPQPAFSRRAQLVEIALQSTRDNYFAKAIVNKVWYRFFGHGLVMPVDQMHPENPASHPELLSWLARDLVAHGYDLSRLIRGMVMSDAYARSSRWRSGSRPPRDLFAVASVRPLSRYQYAAALRLGSTNPDRFAGTVAEAELATRLTQLADGARGFANLVEQPYEGFQVSATEALLFSNGDRFEKEFLRDSAETLVGKLKSLEATDELINTAVWTTLNRPPTASERRDLAEFLNRRRDRKIDACRHLVWALLASSECRFNY